MRDSWVGALMKMLIRSPSAFSASSAPVACAGAAAAGAAVARLCSALGVDESACEIVDMVLCTLPAEVLAAWLTAATWPADPPGFVFCWGELNGVSAVAAADEPA
jgi:hypothetical protein